jgi:TonB family protein
MEHILNGLDPAALLVGNDELAVGDDTTSRGEHRAPEFDIGGLAASFSAIGGVDLSGEACAALALEIVFSQIVERARQNSGATSASIVLKKGTEVIRCASNDVETRELPHWLDIGTGLATECLTTGQVQRCDDAQSDPRPGAQIYYPLGIHSLLLLPLAHNAEVVGVLGVCSSRPSAFTDREVSVLQELTERALDSVRSADASCVRTFPGPAAAQTQLPKHLGILPVDESDADGLREHTKKFKVRYALIFGLSGVALIAMVSMSILVGLHLGRKRALEDFESRARSTAPVASPTPIESQPQVGVSQPNATGMAAAAADIPTGGLLIYQKGKEVLREVPRAGDRPGSLAAVARATPIDSLLLGNASSNVVYHVEPEYPQQALRDGVQGPVVLDLYIDKDGSVQRASIVSGPAVLADAATAAVMQWRFQPHFVDNRRVRMQTRVTVRFTLPNP